VIVPGVIFQFLQTLETKVEHIRWFVRNVTKYFTHINRGKTGKTLSPTALTAMLYSMELVFQTACGVMKMLMHL
jgi:hypothetical protein